MWPTNSFYQYDVIPRCLTQYDGFVGCPGYASQGSLGRWRSYEGIHVTWQVLHPGFISKEGACRWWKSGYRHK